MKKLSILLITVVAMLGMVGCGKHRSTAEVAITQNLNEREKQISSQYEEINQKLDNIQETVSSKDELDRLETENTQLKETIEELQNEESSNDGENAYQKYIDIKFPKDGNVYVCTSEEAVFYSDEFCSKKIKTPQFSSEEIDYTYASNGLGIYCLRTTKNTIVYTTESVSLENKNEVE